MSLQSFDSIFIFRRIKLTMLHTTLLHPEILKCCAQAGHHSKILIADGNYPAASKIGPRAQLVSLQLMPGIPTVAQVLKAILSEVPIDVINTMGIEPTDEYASAGDPPVWNEFRQILKDAGSTRQLEPIVKWDFYDAVESGDHVLTIQTADQALWANLLLSVGVRTPA
ncbi:D-ribose pyranase [Aureliella helgolandensis]|uniref:D-ribose pyranase n=2 Tax=Aureliella helgolandensis TaxID=2527968 RepID=A0A518GAM2_9BACT|nr:D-ribose pyranase [Aureliella helgolandensis]